MVQPTVTNFSPTTRIETQLSPTPFYTRVTPNFYFSTTTVSTIYTVCSYAACPYGWDFLPGPATVIAYDEYGNPLSAVTTYTNACILGREVSIAPYETVVVVQSYSTPASGSCIYLTTSVNANMQVYYSFVPANVTLTETYYNTVANPEKLNLQRLAAVLFIIGFAGIALVTALQAKLLSFPRKEISV
jgi:hypothetical protein